MELRENEMNRIAIAIVAIVSSALVLAAPALADDRTMPQSEFLCQEDEVLGYAPRFGPDRVGCIHVDELGR
ncbi:membrane protein [Mycobacterium phage Pound]|nr:membrane protein [Mycobacterium phage Pound]